MVSSPGLASPAGSPAPGEGAARNGPVIVLSYAYSGAVWVQEALAADAGMAVTSATGIIPLCEAATETWQRVESQGQRPVSRLAAASVRALITAQMTAILADAGRIRWCELAITAAKAAAAFLRLFPDTSVVCVHRSSLDMVQAAVRANQWGLQGTGLLPYLFSHQGNTTAALAAYWADSTDQLLAFEASHADAAYRVRYEDVAAGPGPALAEIRSRLGIDQQDQEGAGVSPAGSGRLPEPAAAVPTSLIPAALLDRIGSLHAELGYPAPGHVAP